MDIVFLLFGINHLSFCLIRIVGIYINGSFTNDGTAAVLLFKSLDDVELYVRTEYSKQIVDFNESQFELQYIRVTTSLANVTDILRSSKMRRNSDANKTYRQKQIGTAKHEQYKSKLRIQRTENIGTPQHKKHKTQKCEKRAKIFGTPEYDEIIKKKRKMYHENKPKNDNPKNTSAERISNFLKLVREGPYYICVVCNRCHYYRSVVCFKPEAYDIDADNFYVELPSFDGKLYICHTCHQKLKKGEIPAQAVVNKLDVFDLPEHLANMNRLEKAIIYITSYFIQKNIINYNA